MGCEQHVCVVLVARILSYVFFFQAEDGIRDLIVTGVQTCALPISTGPATRPRRTLKYGDSFIVVDSHGDIGASAGGTDGLFHCDTRYLSYLELFLNGMQPLLLGSNVRDDNTQLTVDLTNPDVYFDQRLVLPKDTVHVVRTIFLWRHTAYQRFAVRNYGDRAVDLRLSVLFDSDFADLFEVRGLHRAKHGLVGSACKAGTAVLTYN